VVARCSWVIRQVPTPGARTCRCPCSRPPDAIGAAAALADRFYRLVFHQIGQITPGRGTAHLGEADGLAQGYAAYETLRFGIQQPASITAPWVAAAAVSCSRNQLSQPVTSSSPRRLLGLGLAVLGEKTVGDRPGQAAVAVFIGVEGEKPELGQAGAQQPVQLRWRGGDPVQKVHRAVPRSGSRAVHRGKRRTGAGVNGSVWPG
jgi:hypothetical protein